LSHCLESFPVFAHLHLNHYRWDIGSGQRRVKWMLDFLRVSDLMFDIFSMKAHLDDFDGLFGYFVLRWAHFRRGDPRALLRRRRHCLLLGHAALLRNVIGLKVAWRVLVVLN